MIRLPHYLLLLTGLFTVSLAYAQDNIVLKNGIEIKAKVLEVSPTEIKYRRQDNPDGPTYTSGVRDVLLINYANGTKDVLGQSVSGRPTPMVSPQTSAAAQPSIDGLRYHGGWFNRHFATDQGLALSSNEVRSLMISHHDALRAFEHGQRLRRWTYVAAGSAIVLVGTGIGLAAFGGDGNGREGNRFGINDNTAGNTTDMNGNERQGGDGAAITGYALAGGGVLLGVAALILDHQSTRAFRRAANHYRNHPATSLHLTPGYRGNGLGIALQF